MDIVDVILPIYKEKISIIEKSVNSIINQTYKDLHLIVIIDNPENLEAINFIRKLKNVDLIINEKNMGLVKSLNVGLQHCIGKYVARMDADDVSELDRIEKQVNYLNEKNLDIVGSNVRWFDDNKVYFETNLPIDCTKVKKALHKVNCVYHPTFLFKRSILDKISQYETVLYCEDYCFLLNSLFYDFRIGNHPEVLLNYRWSKDGISNSNSAKQRINSIILKKMYKNKIYITGASFKDFSKKYNYNIRKYEKYFKYKNEIKNRGVLGKMVNSIKSFFICPMLFFDDIYIRCFIRKKK